MNQNENPVAVAPRASTITGRLEALQQQTAVGWAVDPARVAQRLTIEIVEGSTVLAVGEADRLHVALAQKGFGDGCYAFAIELPAELFDGQTHTIRAREAKRKVWLTGEQVIARKDAAHGDIEGVSAGVIFGWVPGDSRGKPSELEISVDGAAVGRVMPGFRREDIVANKLAASAFGFRFDLVPFLNGTLDHAIVVLDVASGKQLSGCPLALDARKGWGVVDFDGGIELGGWVTQTDPSAAAPVVELWIENQLAVSVPANGLRSDLRAIGIQRPRCGFRLTVPPRYCNGKWHPAVIRLQGDRQALRGGTRRFRAKIRHGVDVAGEDSISGWVMNMQAPDHPLLIDIREGEELIGTVLANQPRGDVAQAVLKRDEPVPAGFSVKLPRPAPGWSSRTIRISPHGMREPLLDRDILLMPRREVIRYAEGFARSVPNMQWLVPDWVAQLRRRYADSEVIFREVRVRHAPDTETPVDVIIPVYKGREETLACILSVLNARDDLHFDLIVINDASPDPALTAALRQLAEQAGFTLLENPKNLGFVATVNKGMKLHPGRDVILLNSDTVVPKGDWISRLRQAACSDDHIASATPFSNRATICSLPRNLFDNEMPPGMTADDMDALCARTNPGVRVGVPTAVGFCMYIKRQALDEAGLFDEDKWAKGYGEENDFCLRSAAMGWWHVAACDVFVEHHGSISFQGEKDERVRENLAILNGLYPDYPEQVRRFIEDDPLWEYRARVTIDLLKRTASRFMLHVLHQWGGGIEVHVNDLCTRLRAEGEGTLLLRPGPHGWLQLSDPAGVLVIAYPATVPMATIAAQLRALGVWHIHYHQTIGFAETVWDLPAQLGVPFDYTIHDYYLACPRINLLDDSGRFCDQPEIAVCEECVRAAPLHEDVIAGFAAGGGTVTAWRRMHHHQLQRARRVFAPCKDAATRFRKVFDLPQITVQPHLEAPIAMKFRAIPADGELRVAVIGAIGPHKGHDLLQRTARLAQGRDAPIRFVVIGYTCDDAAYEDLLNVDILGPYKPEELHAMVEGADCHAALFLSTWPETYSYTLSEAWRSGLVPVVTGLGALAERVAAENAGVILPETPTALQVVEALMLLASGGFSSVKPRKRSAKAGYNNVLGGYFGLKAAVAPK